MRQNVSFDTLPEAVQTILDEVRAINLKFDTLPAPQQPEEEDRFVDINEIRKNIFPQWKKQTIYNKCSLGEIPHSRIGGRLMFNVKECREWRDSQLQRGKIKASDEIEAEAQAFLSKKGGLK